MGKVHLVIGQNNTGKSNVLRFAQNFLWHLANGAWPGHPQGLDQPRGQNVSTDFAISIAFRPTEEFWEQAGDWIEQHQYKPHLRLALKRLFDTTLYNLSSDELVWIRCIVRAGAQPNERLCVDVGTLEQALQEAAFTPEEETAWRLFSDTISGGTGLQQQEIVMNWMISQIPFGQSISPVVTIEALRSITAESLEGQDHSGRGLIKRLAQLERPGMEHLEDRNKFNEVNLFVATVLEDPSARITIPANQDVIHVISNGVELPLENLGTGLHEVIIMAAAATVLENHIVCIEEPEVHLHPVLQRRLLSYLASHTTNQYLIATHSAHMLDANVASVSHVTMQDARSIVAPATRVGALARVSADLGYRPSDLLQSNFVVWVEGPSDRIYISKWLALEAPDLTEGVHYSLMFYGGSLLKNLTATDQEVNEFIDLRMLNHHLAIVIDSDRKKVGQRMNATKLRVKREFDSDEVEGFAWVTHGYTIENYVPLNMLREAAALVNPSRRFAWRGTRFENPLPNPNGVTAYDKSAIARRVISTWDSGVDFPDDLGAQISRLVAHIRAANN